MNWSSSLPMGTPGAPWRGPLTVSGHPIDAVVHDLQTGFSTVESLNETGVLRRRPLAFASCIRSFW
jgi:hypothetical protein